MKFYGTPRMGVYERDRRRRQRYNQYRRKRLLFRFNSNGEFVTDDAELIVRLKRKFRHDDTGVAAVAETVPVESVAEPVEGVALRRCKKCDFACEGQGELLRHYREMHPKGG